LSGSRKKKFQILDLKLKIKITGHWEEAEKGPYVPEGNRIRLRWIGCGPGGITLVVKRSTRVMLRGPASTYDKEPEYDPNDRTGNPPDLSGGHLLSHVKQEPTVIFFNATHQPAKLVQKTGLFPSAAPNDFVSASALGKVGKLGRFFSVIEELVKWDFQGAGYFLECFNGRNSMAIFDAGNIAAKQSGALFDVPLGKLFIFA
jgi:hypothetical protein